MIKIEKLIASKNIAELLDEKELNDIGQQVVRDYETDLASIKGYHEDIDEWVKLAMQTVEIKTFPWEGAANVKYPLLTTAALQFAARAYPALIPGTKVVRGRVAGRDIDGTKAARAIRIGKHMSYQLIEEMEDWEEEMDKLCTALPILGCMFKKTYYDPVKQVNVSELIYPKDIVVNYYTSSLEKAQRITHVIQMTDNDVYEHIEAGAFIEAELSKTQIDEVDSKVVKQPNDDESTPLEILEQHRYLDLDEDGYKEPYICTVQSKTGIVLRILPCFDEDRVKLSVKTQKILRIEPIRYFTKFGFVPSSDGCFYDVGFGVLLGPINNTINTLVNQLLDAGTLSNLQAGFISRGIRIKGGDKPFKPGEWKTTQSTGDDLRKGIMPLPVNAPSQVLFSLLGMMIDAGEKLSSVTETLTGGIPGQNTKATVAMAAIEQGLKVFSSIYKRIHRSLKKEYRKLFELNAKYLSDESYFTVLDAGAEGGETIAKEDYNVKDANVVPYSDPNVATEEQRMAKIQALEGLLQQGLVNPQEYAKRFLEATEQPNVEALLQMPEPQPNPEIEMDKQELDMKGQELQYKIQESQAKTTREAQVTEVEMDIKSRQADAAIELSQTQALLNIANAEAVEVGNQLEGYKIQLEAIKAKQERKDKDNKKKMDADDILDQPIPMDEPMSQAMPEQQMDVSQIPPEGI